MLKRINNWHLSLMVIIVSIISLALIQNHVLAQWADPNVTPEEGTNQVFFNPAVGALDLNNYTIIDNTEASFILDPGGVYGLRISGTDYAGWFDGNVNIIGTLTIDGVEIEGGADRFIELLDTPNSYVGERLKFVAVNQDEDGLEFIEFVGPSGLWSDWGADIYRNSNVAIGNLDPDVLLDIESNTGNDASIDIKSGTNDFWRIYNEETSNDLRFYSSSSLDVLVLKNTGEVLINTSTIQADLTVDGTGYFSSSDTKTLSVYNTLASDVAIYGEGFNAIKGYSSAVNGIGVYGESDIGNGVYGIGATGVYGESNATGDGTYGVYGFGGTGKYGGFFEGGTEDQGAGAKGVTSSGIAGVWGVGTEATNVGVRGNGFYGVAGFVNTTSGAGIYGQGSTTADAAYFEGDVVIAPLGAADAFLKLDTNAGEPSAGDCTVTEKGRMIVDISNNKLWVCSDVWRSATLF